jgi:hypothetical protein
MSTRKSPLLGKQLFKKIPLSFVFCEKEIFLWERGNIFKKIWGGWGGGELPRHNGLGLLLLLWWWGRSLKIHIEIEKGVV